MILSSTLLLAQLRDWETTVGGKTETCLVDGVPTFKCLEIVFGNILFLSGGFIILALFIMFVMGSFTYLTSFGNAEKIKKAQGTFRYAIIGFVLFLSATLILKAIDFVFLGNQENIFRFSIPGP